MPRCHVKEEYVHIPIRKCIWTKDAFDVSLCTTTESKQRHVGVGNAVQHMNHVMHTTVHMLSRNISIYDWLMRLMHATHHENNEHITTQSEHERCENEFIR